MHAGSETGQSKNFCKRVYVESVQTESVDALRTLIPLVDQFGFKTF